MATVHVAVVFRGIISVQVPDSLSQSDANLLAEKLAPAVALASVDNVDCGDALEEACMEFHEESSISSRERAEHFFDQAKAEMNTGTWESVGVVPRA